MVIEAESIDGSAGCVVILGILGKRDMIDRAAAGTFLGRTLIADEIVGRIAFADEMNNRHLANIEPIAGKAEGRARALFEAMIST